MGSHIAKSSNKSMVDRLVDDNRAIHSPMVEGAFRAVDRAKYFDQTNLSETETVDPYDDGPWKRNNLHISAPCIYAKVVEALDLRSGLSFLNLGSGTGYLNTIVGLLVGPNGVNHGIELHEEVVEYAYSRLEKFKQESYAIDKYEFSEPIFIQGNFLNLNPNSRYDRIYLGAACLPDLENFMKMLIKPNGGVLVMPYESQLMRYTRIGETEWRSEKLMEVTFTLMIRTIGGEPVINMPLAKAKTLKELCRTSIRQHLRDKTDLKNPNLLHSDNISSRRYRKERAERKLLKKEQRAKLLQELQLKKNRDRLSLSKPRVYECPECGNGETVPDQFEFSVSEDNSSSSRILTRSASRRVRQSNPNTQPNSKSTATGNIGDTSGNESSTNTIYGDTANDDEIEDVDNNGRNDNDDEVNKADCSFNSGARKGTRRNSKEHDKSNNCARTRPFTRNNRIRRTLYPSQTYRTVSLTEQMPNQDVIAHTIDQSSSPSALSTQSSSFSSVENQNDLHNLEEYDYIGRQVVLNIPGLLRMRDVEQQINIHGPHSTSGSSVSNFLDPNESNVSEESCDSLVESFDDDNESELLSSDSSRTFTHFSDAEVGNVIDNDLSDEYIEENDNFNDVIGSPRPSTSGISGRKKVDNNKEDEKAQTEQEPVARRLRSKNILSDQKQDNVSSVNSDQREKLTKVSEPEVSSTDSKVASCQSNKIESQKHRCRHSHHRNHHQHQNKESGHGDDEELYSNTCPNHHRHRLEKRGDKTTCLKHLKHSGSSSSTSLLRNQFHNQELFRPTSRADRFPNLRSTIDDSLNHQTMLSGRLLIATALGTTFSFATHHYRDLTSSGSRSGLFGERSLDRFSPGSVSSSSGQQQLSYNRRHLGKRKRPSSSSSSESSEISFDNNNNLETRKTQLDGSRGRTRCRCNRLRATTRSASSSIGTASNEIPIMRNSEASSTTAMKGNEKRLSCQIKKTTRVSRLQEDPGSRVYTSSEPTSTNATRESLPGSHGAGNASSDGQRRRSSRDRNLDQLLSFSRVSCSSPHSRHHRNGATNEQQRPSEWLLEDDTPSSSARTTSEVATASSSGRAASNHLTRISKRWARDELQEVGRREFLNLTRRGKRKQEREKRAVPKRREDECERYHNHISSYIRQLPLPRVLFGYLNYDRNL